MKKKYKITVPIVLIFLMSVIFLYFGFKSSTKDLSPIIQTKFNNPIDGLKSEEVVLKNWTYNPAKKIMQIQIHTEYLSNDIPVKELVFHAYEKKSKKNVPTDIVFHMGNDYVVQLKDIPKSFYQIKVIIKEKYIGTDQLSDQNHIAITIDYRKAKVDKNISERLPIKEVKKKGSRILEPTILEQINENNSLLYDLNEKLDQVNKESIVLENQNENLDELSKSQKEIIKKEIEKDIENNQKDRKKVNNDMEKIKRKIIHLNLFTRKAMLNFLEDKGEKL